MRTGNNKLFKIYEHPTERIEAVKVGFSWPAFFLSVIWMMVHRLWYSAVLWIALYAIVHVAEGFVERMEDSSLTFLLLFVVLIAWGALCLVPGLRGNSWREKNLVRRGYSPIQTIRAESSGDAISKAKLAASGNVSR
ncbi:Protein of unknown function [Nitrosospira sp. Nsp14]|uniref:DUF2628 domain-containing protein n=1 Tax=Nitrosospira sp. Nsp14 TaxID=1855333 RepID=UPI0008ECC371|nr:Protein of unknown function [Nitrosospira sp. Nsp14]